MKAKKIFALALALVMLFSLAAPAFADDESKYKPYENYMNIGDSIARGCGIEYYRSIAEGKAPNYGMSTYYDDAWNNDKGGNNFEESFPAQVKEAVGADTIKNLQYMGLRSVETLYALGGNVDPWAVDTYCELDFHGHTDPVDEQGTIKAETAEFQQNTGNADLITLQVGSNDVFYAPLSMSGLLDAFTGKGDADILTAVENAVGCIWDGYFNFLEYYPKIINRIFELQKGNKRTAKDFDLVLVGLFSPLANAPVTDEILIPVGEALTIVVDLMNSYLRSLADRYDNVYYTDISAVETPVSSGAVSIMNALTDEDGKMMHIDTHPTLEGYAYIARQILSVLPQEEVKYPDTFIRFDLPNKETVTSVKLGTRDAMFTQDGYELTVPNYSPLVSSMTVTGMTEDGKTVIYVYSLSYKLGEGYTANRITGTNDLTSSLTRAISGFISVIKTVITAIKGLFNS